MSDKLPTTKESFICHVGIQNANTFEVKYLDIYSDKSSPD